jgi:D-alanyl-lipoteichoic acid acyltransferase DltB (MBOAT superfamily)
LVFTSPTFLFVFLPGCLALYFAVRGMAARNAVLLAASLLFYAWGEPVMVAVMLGSIAFNYGAARWIDGQEGPARNGALAVGVAVNLLILAVFKYANFLSALAEALPGGMKRTQIALPLGISFFTFHALSYLIDVYRRRFPANRRLGEVALYIAFFPQLIAGPIVRYKTIAARLHLRRHSWGRASAGLRLMVIGLAMKLLLADPFAPLAAAVFDHPQTLAGAGPNLLQAWTGALAFTLQIYFDFAGYSNMAIGLGLVFGFSLPRNFDLPYRARSITQFWRRWHMTLSAWFRDYLYIPLGGNRGAARQTWRNLIVVFLLCGLWHGPNWTFIAWGAWQGAFLILERARLGKGLKAMPAPLAWAYAFTAVVFGWVLFRAPTLGVATEVWRGMLGLNGGGGFGPSLAKVVAPGQAVLAIAAFAMAIFGLRLPKIARWPAWPRLQGLLDGGAIAGLLLLCLMAVAGNGYSPFLYYRF